LLKNLTDDALYSAGLKVISFDVIEINNRVTYQNI